MTLRLRALELHVMTGDGPVGLHLPFSPGLTVLRAPNNSGKSAALQAIIYAMGLEGMFSASREVPLPHVMTDRIEVEARELPIVHSHVALEVENAAGDIRTFQRVAVDPVIDHHLVSVWEGPRLTGDSQEGPRRQDYFVRRPGAARRELGFHHYLAEFIGWDLPSVQHYDGSESPLYLEAIFPLAYVEQKQGWGGIRPRMPTYFGIRDVGRRSVEFVLDLSTLERARRRAELDQQLRDLAAEWAAERAKLEAAAERDGGRLLGVPARPTTWTDAVRPQIAFVIKDEPLDIGALIQRVESEIAVTPVEPPIVEDQAPELAEELTVRGVELREVVARANALEEALALAETELGALDRRIEATQEDKQRLTDIRLLEALGSPLGIDAMVQHDCPTCHQSLDAVEVEEGEIPLALDDNLRLLDERLVTLKSMRNAAESNTTTLSIALTSARDVASSLRLRIRSLKAALVQPNRMPSIASIERRVALQRRLEDLEALSATLGASAERLERIANRSDALRAQLADVSGEFSSSDTRKLRLLQESVHSQLALYGFGSLPVEEVEISLETLHPTHEGFDLSFDISASDTVRTKWAYFLGLAEVALREPSHHPRMLILDEPGQQEIDRASFAALLRRAAEVASDDLQIVLATSESEAFVRESLPADSAATLHPIEGKLLQPLR
jgi:hypothetical protein